LKHVSAPAVFDAHVHIWSDDRQAYPQVPGMERPESHKGSAEWLLDLMAESGVAGGLLVQTPWYGEDNRYFVDSMRRYPGAFVSLGYLPDPLAPDAADKLDRQYHVQGFRGIRIHLIDPAIVEGVAEGKADPLISRAGELGVPVQFLNRVPERHELILGLARRFPDTPFINDHLGHPRINEGYPYEASRSFFECGKLPNVYAKVSMHNEHTRSPYPWSDLQGFQKLTLEAYGARKLMWGSNFPMSMPNPTYQQRLEAVRIELPFLSDDDRAWILALTAKHLWQLT
jgi:predicted TIM-barrel fold metal-dependent hydrolase